MTTVYETYVEHVAERIARSGPDDLDVRAMTKLAFSLPLDAYHQRMLSDAIRQADLKNLIEVQNADANLQRFCAANRQAARDWIGALMNGGMAVTAVANARIRVATDQAITFTRGEVEDMRERIGAIAEVLATEFTPSPESKPETVFQSDDTLAHACLWKIKELCATHGMDVALPAIVTPVTTVNGLSLARNDLAQDSATHPLRGL